MEAEEKKSKSWQERLLGFSKKYKHVFSFAVVVLMAVGLCLTVFINTFNGCNPKPESYEFSGIVRDYSSGFPIAGALIEPESNPSIEPVRSDSLGAFKFVSKKPYTNVRLIFSHDSYAQEELSIDFWSNNTFSNSGYPIRLHRKNVRPQNGDKITLNFAEVDIILEQSRANPQLLVDGKIPEVLSTNKLGPTSSIVRVKVALGRHVFEIKNSECKLERVISEETLIVIRCM